MPNPENRPPSENEPELRSELGQLVATPGALNNLNEAEQCPLELIACHVTGDWGELDEDDQPENGLFVDIGYRILSAFRLHTGVKVWIITDVAQSMMTIVLPAEY